jgi:hypothetical protein
VGNLPLWRRFVGRLEDEAEKEDWMKRVILVTVVALVAMLVFAPMALAQSASASASAMSASAGATTMETTGVLGPTGGPSILLPAAALLLGSGILTYAILRRR